MKETTNNTAQIMDAFQDLATILNVKLTNAPFNQAILALQTNSQKAPTPAHAFAHALDHYLGTLCELPLGHGEVLASEAEPGYESWMPESFQVLMATMKEKAIDPTEEEMEAAKRHAMKCGRKQFDQLITTQAPGKMTEKKKEVWDKAVEDLWDSRDQTECLRYHPSFPERTNPWIDRLAELKRKIDGQDISNNEKMHLNDLLYRIRNWKEGMLIEADVPEAVKVPTEFWTNSQYFDKIQQETQDNWKPHSEMFARAFVCYVEDKMRQKGIVNEMLACDMERYGFEQDGNKLYAVPMGEDRQTISEKMNGFIKDMIRRCWLTPITWEK